MSLVGKRDPSTQVLLFARFDAVQDLVCRVVVVVVNAIGEVSPVDGTLRGKRS